MVEFDEEKQKKRLSEFRRKEEEDLAQMLSDKYGIPYVDLTGFPIDTDALRLIDESVAREGFIAGFDLVGKKVKVAIEKPEKEKTKQIIKTLEEDGYVPQLYIASRTSLEKAWAHYKDLSFATESTAGLLEISDAKVEEFIEKLHTLDEVTELITQTLTSKESRRITRVVEIMLAGALSLRASDVHIEPGEERVTIRMRVDGLLTEVVSFDFDTYKLLNSRIKLLSGLKLNVKDTSQDGRFTLEIADKEIEIRTSVIPGNYGESIVMRVLDPDTIAMSVEKLGMQPSLLERIEREIKKPNGMIINSGPTGSGKTTTLYAFLKQVNQPGVKIITIEDPVEYHLDGVVQTQVDRDKGYTFSKGLESILRQDPDVVMVGEIRDKETANTAIHAGLTGHLVFTTLHTNNAAGVFPRLLSFGGETEIVGSAVNVAMAQRLVRRLCPHCKKQVPISGETKAVIEAVLSGASIPDQYNKLLPPQHVWEPVGCDKCSRLGYRGRIGIFEAIFMNEEIEQLIRRNPTEREMEKAIKHQDTLNMKQDGVLKVLEGITSLAEVRRVVSLDE